MSLKETFSLKVFSCFECQHLFYIIILVNYFNIYFTLLIFVILKRYKIISTLYLHGRNSYGIKVYIVQSHPVSSAYSPYNQFFTSILYILPEIACTDHYFYIFFHLFTQMVTPYTCTLLFSFNSILKIIPYQK